VKNIGSATTDFSVQAGEYVKEIEDVIKMKEEKLKRRQALVGEVVSTKCLKSITVRIAREKFYPKYNASITRHKKIMAHDEKQECKDGDIVRIVPCRPMSRRKRHTLIDILKKAPDVSF